mgnify:CR=1 FL=1
MKKWCCGFSLIEVLVGLAIFSMLLTAIFKTYSHLKHEQTIVSEQCNLLPYIGAFEYFLVHLDVEQRCGNWYCYQNKVTKNRIFSKEKINKFWRYKIHVKCLENEWYKIVFFNKTKFLGKLYYHFKIVN